jgi:hypothetical protein
VARCKSCGASFTWATTTRGRSMPVDSEPTPDGNVWIDVLGVAHVTGGSGGEPPEGAKRYTSHFASCPGAGQHRKARE